MLTICATQLGSFLAADIIDFQSTNLTRNPHVPHPDSSRENLHCSIVVHVTKNINIILVRVAKIPLWTSDVLCVVRA